MSSHISVQMSPNNKKELGGHKSARKHGCKYNEVMNFILANLIVQFAVTAYISVVLASDEAITTVSIYYMELIVTIVGFMGIIGEIVPFTYIYSTGCLVFTMGNIYFLALVTFSFKNYEYNMNILGRTAFNVIQSIYDPSFKLGNKVIMKTYISLLISIFFQIFTSVVGFTSIFYIYYRTIIDKKKNTFSVDSLVSITYERPSSTSTVHSNYADPSKTIQNIEPSIHSRSSKIQSIKNDLTLHPIQNRDNKSKKESIIMKGLSSLEPERIRSFHPSGSAQRDTSPKGYSEFEDIQINKPLPSNRKLSENNNPFTV